MTPARIAPVLFVVGGAVLFLSEVTVPQVIGAVMLMAAIAIGVFAIATPDFMERDEPPEPD
jgi:membrane-bound ClpP family serine protease